MYLRPGIVILSFFLSHGVLFFLVSLAIKAETCDGYYSTAVGTHVPWVIPRDDVHFTEQMGHARTMSVPRRACSQNPEHTLTRTVFSQFATVYTLNSCTFSQFAIYLKFMHIEH